MSSRSDHDFSSLPDWAQRPLVMQIFAQAHALGGEARIVGGAVRDWLSNYPVGDIDMVINLPIETVARHMVACDMRVVETGLKHGTITLYDNDDQIELTQTRVDLETDGRHAIVAHDQDWARDAARRDFTINALYAHPETLEITDFFGGLADLEARRVRFIGDARQRIREYHLRILRYFRFQARFGRETDDEALAACADLAETLGANREGLPPPAFDIRGRVVRVADGDTVSVLDGNNKQHKVRLFGIDTPERDQPHGSLAGAALADLVDGKRVGVVVVETTAFHASNVLDLVLVG